MSGHVNSHTVRQSQWLVEGGRRDVAAPSGHWTLFGICENTGRKTVLRQGRAKEPLESYLQ